MPRIAQPAHDAPASEWTVYADALQEAADPRGELIALNLAIASGMSTADRDAYLATHKAALFGPAAEFAEALRITWVGCLADDVEIHIATPNGADIVGAYLASPLASATRSLALVGGPGKVDLAAAVKVLAEQWPAQCRSLALVDDRAATTTMLASRDFEPPENLVTFGELGSLWKLPLEALRLEVADSHQLELGKIDAPTLRSFTLRCLRYGSAYEGDSPLSTVFGEAKWPELRAFELRLPEEYSANIIDDKDAYIPYYFADEDYADRADEAEDGENYEGANWDQLVPLLNNLKRSPLERLALTSFDSADSLLAALESAQLPKTLVELDLSDSSISSPGWFVTHKALFHTVKRLVLSNVSMSEDDAKQLAALGPEIVHSTGSGAKYRYVVGSE